MSKFESEQCKIIFKLLVFLDYYLEYFDDKIKEVEPIADPLNIGKCVNHASGMDPIFLNFFYY